MATVPATEFKAKCLEFMDRVAERRETFVITKRGKPVAMLGPVKQQTRDTIFGWLRGKATITADIVGPVLPPEAWDTLGRWDELDAEIRPKQVRRAKRRARVNAA